MAAARFEAAEVSREEEKTRRQGGKNERRVFDPIYKEKGNRWARKTRRPKNDYPAARTP